MNEIWKTIDDYPDYMISSMGRVKSLKNGKEIILKMGKLSKGYYGCNLSNNGNQKTYRIHRLVAQAFIPNPENKPHIDHINTDKTDNRVENLRWVTNKENCNNSLTLENRSKCRLGIKHPNSKPIIQFTKNGKLIRKWDCSMDIERELGINHSLIPRCCKGKLQTTGGYKWKYYYKGIWLKNHIPLKYKKVA